MESIRKIANLSSLSITNALVQRSSIGFNRYTILFPNRNKTAIFSFLSMAFEKKKPRNTFVQTVNPKKRKVPFIFTILKRSRMYPMLHKKCFVLNNCKFLQEKGLKKNKIPCILVFLICILRYTVNSILEQSIPFKQNIK